MTISTKTRKILWGRSGNQCAICKNELIIDATPDDDESVIAAECHIISPRPQGPRHDPAYPVANLDSYENLILLCGVHHKMVDDQTNTYSVDDLRQTKSNHEQFIKKKLKKNKSEQPLRIRRIEQNIPSHLSYLVTGKQVLEVMGNACAASIDHDELLSEKEIDLVGGFLQSARDWGELWSDIEPAHRSKALFDLTQSIKKLENEGFFVFGGREDQILEGGNQEKPSLWPVGILRVIRKDTSICSQAQA